jgi:hypothetical protein
VSDASSWLALEQLAVRINTLALETIAHEGEHAAMYFLRQPSGEVSPRLFEAVISPVGDARAAEMAAAVSGSLSDAVVFVSEAWSASRESVPYGEHVRDSDSATDVLLVVALDRSGNQVVLETELRAGRSGVEALDTVRHGPEYVVRTLDQFALRGDSRAGSAAGTAGAL